MSIHKWPFLHWEAFSTGYRLRQTCRTPGRKPLCGSSLITAASSTFIVGFSSFTGFWGYASMEVINGLLILPAAVAFFAGCRAGTSIMSTKLEGRRLQVIFSIILFDLCAKPLRQFYCWTIGCIGRNSKRKIQIRIEKPQIKHMRRVCF